MLQINIIKFLLLSSTILLVTITGCFDRSSEDFEKIGVLDRLRYTKNLEENFYQNFKEFYRLLKNKDWAATYDYRSKKFKSSVTKEFYLKDMKSIESEWNLVSYEVLSMRSFQMKDKDLFIRVIIKFVEDPGPNTSYSLAEWVYEDDDWKCKNAGPEYSPFFNFAYEVWSSDSQ